jgi:exopolysaccharide production protein ExoQ
MFALLPIGAGPAGATEGSALRQLVYSAIFGAAAITALRNWDGLWRVVGRLDPWFLALLAFVGVSVLWSPERFVSLKRVVQVYGVVVVALALVSGRGQYPGRAADLVRWAMTLLLFISIVFIAVFPSFGIAENGWRGLTSTKNNFGQMVLLCGLLWFFAVRRGQVHPWIAVPLILICLACLGLSRSLTSLVAFAGVATFIGTMVLTRATGVAWQGVIGLALLAVLIALHCLIVVYGLPSFREVDNFVYSLTGRDLSLAGRTYLWELIWNEIREHPMLGTGYGGFWLGLEGKSGMVAYLVRWGYPGQAHNGYLDMLNEIGIIGLFLVVVVIVRYAMQLIRLAAEDRELATMHACFLVAVLTLNIAEGVLLRTTHMWWMFLVVSMVEVAAYRQKSSSVNMSTAKGSGKLVSPRLT